MGSRALGLEAAAHLDGLSVVLLHHAAEALRHVGHLAQVELVVELDGRGQEVVHHVAVQLDGGVHQLGAHARHVGVKGVHVAVNQLRGREGGCTGRIEDRIPLLGSTQGVWENTGIPVSNCMACWG